ncbi:hypothetical protein PSPO01_03731 [Paraphaeosphaeria sporulosa]
MLVISSVTLSRKELTRTRFTSSKPYHFKLGSYIIHACHRPKHFDRTYHLLNSCLCESPTSHASPHLTSNHPLSIGVKRTMILEMSTPTLSTTITRTESYHKSSKLAWLSTNPAHCFVSFRFRVHSIIPPPPLPPPKCIRIPSQNLCAENRCKTSPPRIGTRKRSFINPPKRPSLSPRICPKKYPKTVCGLYCPGFSSARLAATRWRCIRGHVI